MRQTSEIVKAIIRNMIWCLLAIASIVVLSLVIIKEYEFRSHAVLREGKVSDYGVEISVSSPGKNGGGKVYTPWVVVESTDNGSSTREFCWIEGNSQVFGEYELGGEEKIRERLDNLVKTGHIRYYVHSKDNGAWQECRTSTNIDNSMYWFLMPFAFAGLVWSSRRIRKEVRVLLEQRNAAQPQ